jgi:membrane fusion protein (multidrug efflux system)
VRQDGFVEITDGVHAGDRIVADGLNKLQPGQPVRVLGQRPASGAGAMGRRPGGAAGVNAGARPAA